MDVVVAGSQKALMIPPGLAFASVSQRALDAAAAKPGGRYYFDWVETAKQQRKDPPNSPFTPPVTLLAALDVALGMIEDEGIENVWERHALLARATRAGAAALGLDLYGDPDERSNVVTAIALPESIDGKKVPKILRDRYGITANGGQAQLAGKIIRIAHCGYFGGFDILTSLSGPGDDARAARPPGRAGRRRRRRAEGVPRSRRAGRSARSVSDRPRILVKEQIADTGVDLLREHFDVDLGADWSDEQFRERLPDVPRDPDPLGDEDDRGADRARHEAARDRPRRRRRQQRRRRGRDEARHRRRERAAVERRHRRRAHDGAAAVARAQHPAGARLAARAQVGAQQVRRRRGLREDARRSSASAASASSSPSARAASACTSSPTTRSSAPSATASSGSRRPRRSAEVYADGRLPHDPPAGHAPRRAAS